MMIFEYPDDGRIKPNCEECKKPIKPGEATIHTERPSGISVNGQTDMRGGVAHLGCAEGKLVPSKKDGIWRPPVAQP
jgi:hypothetical protein